MKKSTIYSWLVVFCLFFIAPQMVYGLFGEYFETENYENRVLAEKPVFDILAVSSYPSSFETYYNDTLPFRTQLIEANGLMNYYLFQESPVSKVIVGQDGWLFYNPDGADGDPIGDLNGDTFYSDEELEILKDTLVQARDVLASQGREFVVMITPNKESVYGNKYLPSIYQADNDYTTADQVVQYLEENSDLRVVYPKDEIFTAMEEFPDVDFYYSADTHWNQAGAYIGVKCLLDELGHEISPIQEDMIVYDQAAASKDLANMMGLAKYISEKNSYAVVTTPKANVTVISEDFWGAYHYTSDSANEEKIFFIRDSFATAMMPYMQDCFSEAYFIHTQSYTPDMINEIEPDIVVYEITERSIATLFNFEVEP